MKAFYKLKNQPPKLVEVPKPTPKENEALIRIVRVGICGTDHEITKGYIDGFEGIVGHEFMGVVEEVNSADGTFTSLVGKRVVGEVNIPCHQCSTCIDSFNLSLKRNHCPERQCLGLHQKDGCFAEYITLPILNLHLVPDPISDEEACFIEPLSAACRILEQRIVQKFDQVAIIGDGKLGLLIAEILIHENLDHKVTMIGKHHEKMSLLGSDIIPVFLEEGTKNELQDHFDVVIESSGSPSGFDLACALVRPLGKVVLKTTCAGNLPDLKHALNEIVVKEIQIFGSRCGPFKTAIELLEHGNMNLKKYITKEFKFEEMEEAFELSKQKDVLKVQLVM